MRYIIMALILLTACTQTIVEIDEPEQGQVIQSYMVSEHASETQDVSLSIRRTDQGFAPDIIEVNEGDHVTLMITNTAETFRFSIDEYPAEEVYHSGETLFYKFTAETSGSFSFGDESRITSKGTLVVS